MFGRLQRAFLMTVIQLCGAIVCAQADTAEESLPPAFRQFFRQHCVRCHGSAISKADIQLHELRGVTTEPADLDRLERILDVLERGQMPPADEPRPAADEKEGLLSWLRSELREAVARNAAADAAPQTRRLTNVEYENTMRDLIGFRLKLIEDLPKDPVRPYRFNNTADYMRIGPEQIDRYLECARRVMASAIVDPKQPETKQTRREWQAHGVDRGLGGDEVGVWGNRRNTPATGMGLKNFPETGEFRIRIQASAILPPGVDELELRLVMGYGLDVNSSTQRIEPVGSVALRNSPDDPQVFEFRGRIENYPVQTGVVKRQVRQPDTLVITPQNLYDDGTLNDDNNFGRTRNVSMPRAVVNWIEFEAPVCESWPPAYHQQILFESPLSRSAPTAYVQHVIERFMSRAYRRPATPEEVDRFVQIYGLLRPALPTREAAFRETLAMVLVSPQFLYHTVADEQTSEQHALASRLSYFLWASMPDEQLLRLADAGQLNDATVIEQQVRRLLTDKRAKDFVRNFTEQWLSLAKLRTIPINRDLFPRFLYYVPRGERAGTEEPYRPTIRDYMYEETIAFVVELIRRNASVLDIVDSDFACLNQPLAVHYGIDGVQGNQLRPVSIRPEHGPDHRLGGLLTQGAVLVGNGTGSAPHPIYRAVWLREAILGEHVPEPPAEVPALSDSAGDSGEKALTITQLLAKHRQVESCNDCHSRLDPWGIPFERYNAIGRYQPFVPRDGSRIQAFSSEQHGDLAGYAAYLDTVNTVEVVADTRLPDGTDISGMQQLKDYLLRNKRREITDNVVRRLLTYAIGRELTVRDRFAVQSLVQKTESRSLGFQDIIIAICQSDTFRNSNHSENRP